MQPNIELSSTTEVTPGTRNSKHRYSIVVKFSNETRITVLAESAPHVEYFATLRAYCQAISAAGCKGTLKFNEAFLLKSPNESFFEIHNIALQILQNAANGIPAETIERQIQELESRYYEQKQPENLRENGANNSKTNWQGVTINDASTYVTPIHVALIDHNVNLAIQLLQQEGTNVGLLDGRALNVFQTNPFRYRQESPYDPFYFQGYGATYLHWAARYLNVAQFKQVIDNCPLLLNSINVQAYNHQSTPIMWAITNTQNNEDAVKIALLLLDQPTIEITFDDAKMIIGKAIKTNNPEIIRNVIQHKKIAEHWPNYIDTANQPNNTLQVSGISAINDTNVETLLDLGLTFVSTDMLEIAVYSLYDADSLERIFNGVTAANNIDAGKLIKACVNYNNVPALKIILNKWPDALQGFQAPRNGGNLLDFLTNPETFMGLGNNPQNIERHYEMVAYLINKLHQNPMPTGRLYPICNNNIVDSGNVHTIMAYYYAMGQEFRTMMSTPMSVETRTPREWLSGTRGGGQGVHSVFVRSQSASVQIIDYLLKLLTSEKSSSDTLNTALDRVLTNEKNLMVLAAELQSETPTTGIRLIFEHLFECQAELNVSAENLHRLNALIDKTEVELDPINAKRLFEEINAALSDATSFLLSPATEHSMPDQEKQQTVTKMVKIATKHNPVLIKHTVDFATIQAFIEATTPEQKSFINRQREKSGLLPLVPGKRVGFGSSPFYQQSTVVVSNATQTATSSSSTSSSSSSASSSSSSTSKKPTPNNTLVLDNKVVKFGEIINKKKINNYVKTFGGEPPAIIRQLKPKGLVFIFKNEAAVKEFARINPYDIIYTARDNKEVLTYFVTITDQTKLQRLSRAVKHHSKKISSPLQPLTAIAESVVPNALAVASPIFTSSSSAFPPPGEHVNMGSNQPATDVASEKKPSLLSRAFFGVVNWVISFFSRLFTYNSAARNIGMVPSKNERTATIQGKQTLSTVKHLDHPAGGGSPPTFSNDE